MGRSPCCDKVGLKKGPWTPEEDQKLLAYIEEHGHGNWRALPSKAGLQRCGKSCRLRWTNYLRPDIKRGKFSLQEEQTIIQLHALLGNRWSAIATHLPKRTDNEIKNYWNTHLKKRLTKMGIDPITHKPKNDALLSNDGQTNKNASNLSHMAQWESARLEAEARLVRQSKLRANSNNNNNNNSTSSSTSTFVQSAHHHQAAMDHHQFIINPVHHPQAALSSDHAGAGLTTTTSSSSAHNHQLLAAPTTAITISPTSKTSLPQNSRCLDVLRALHGTAAGPSSWSNTNNKTTGNSRNIIDIPSNNTGVLNGGGGHNSIESPTSTLSFSENGAPNIHHHHGSAGPSRTLAATTTTTTRDQSSVGASAAAGMIEFMGNNSINIDHDSNNIEPVKEEEEDGGGDHQQDHHDQDHDHGWKIYGNDSSSTDHLPPPTPHLDVLHYSAAAAADENSMSYASGHLHDMTLLPAIQGTTTTWSTTAAAHYVNITTTSTTTKSTTTTTTSINNTIAAAPSDLILKAADQDNSDHGRHSSSSTVIVGNFIENFTELLLSNSANVDHRSTTDLSIGDGDSTGGGDDDDPEQDNDMNSGGATTTSGCSSGNASRDGNGDGDVDGEGDYYEDNKNYWNSIFNLVNSSPSSSPLF